MRHRFLFRGLAALCLGAAGLLACSSSSSPDAPAPDGGPPADGSTGPVTSQVVGAAGGTVTTPDGVKIVIPAGALASDVTITVALTSSAPPLTQAEAVGPTYVLGPEGQQFMKPVSVTLPFEPANLLPGSSAADVAVYTAPQGSSAYVSLATTIADATHVTAQTTHFSDVCPGDFFVAPDGAVTTPDGAAPCSGVMPMGAMVSVMAADAAALPGGWTGGTIASGTYDLTSYTTYGCAHGFSIPIQETIVVAGSGTSGTIQIVLEVQGDAGTGGQALAGTYTTSGSSLIVTQTCPAVDSGATAPASYTATPTTLTIAGSNASTSDGGTCGGTVSVFALQ